MYLFYYKSYFFQSNVFSFHSIKIPTNKIIKNIILVFVHKIILDLKILGINGIIKIISTSKIIKIIAIRKNCIENGIRAELKKLNPHSNGICFSRDFCLFLEIIVEIDIRINVTVKLVKIVIKIIIIKKTILGFLENNVL